jgi:hypothetical protein
VPHEELDRGSALMEHRDRDDFPLDVDGNAWDLFDYPQFLADPIDYIAH